MHTEVFNNLTNGKVSFWQHSLGQPARRNPLGGPLECDVAIIGGGLTGLWTAYYLKKAKPSLDIAILEKNFAGFGASGRNGGWMSAEPAGQFRHYAKSGGEAAARELQREMFGAVQESVDVAQQEGFAEDLVHDGLMHVATSNAQLQRIRNHIGALKSQGWADDDLVELGPTELDDRIHIAAAKGGYWTPHCARVHPAKYVRGLAAVVENLGVTIYEDTAAVEVQPHRVVTNRGEVRAKFVVEALEGYTHSLKGKERKLLPMNSTVVITKPLTDAQMAAVGWHGGELIGDMAHSFTYMHRTADNRIALGGRGVPYNFRSSYSREGVTASGAVEQLYARLLELFPALAGVELEHTWSGVLGVPRDWSAAVNFDRTTGIISAGGYVGHGLSGTNLAGRTVRDLILGEDTALSRLPWIGRQARKWEVEPIRWLGANTIYGAYRVADRVEYASGSPKTSWIARVSNLVGGR